MPVDYLGYLSFPPMSIWNLDARGRRKRDIDCHPQSPVTHQRCAFVGLCHFRLSSATLLLSARPSSLARTACAPRGAHLPRNEGPVGMLRRLAV
jgi:hypothetical protein